MVGKYMLSWQKKMKFIIFNINFQNYMALFHLDNSVHILLPMSKISKIRKLCKAKNAVCLNTMTVFHLAALYLQLLLLYIVIIIIWTDISTWFDSPLNKYNNLPIFNINFVCLVMSAFYKTLTKFTLNWN